MSTAWCTTHPAVGREVCGCPPSAEPDGEATGWHRHQTQGVVRDSDCKCSHGVRNVPAPSPDGDRAFVESMLADRAQDGAEVEALVDLILDHCIEEGSRNLGQYRTEWVCSCGHKFITDGHQGESFRVKHAEHVAALLAQRDKDRNAAVAAKVAEQIAQAIEAVLPNECWVTRNASLFCTDWIGMAFGEGRSENFWTEEMCCAPCRVRAAIARAAAPAGDER